MKDSLGHYIFRCLGLFCWLWGGVAGLQHLSAQIVLSSSKTTLGAVIERIQSQTDYQFFYEDRLAELPVQTVAFQGASLQTVLDAVLKGTGITYQVEEEVVYLSAPLVPVPTAVESEARSRERVLTGTVTDVAGEPLVGVNVQVEGALAQGTVTDWEGRYSLPLTGQPALVFSYVGYRTLTVPSRGRIRMDVQLEEDAQLMDEVVVTALGIPRQKRLLGYAIQELKGTELNVTGEPSVAAALQGKVAGLELNLSATGLAGSAKMIIRGYSSLADNDQPLWVVDGVPYNDQSISEASRYEGIDRGSALMDLNPNDIESISVLKGPNAAALYGSRAGNGVILITTQKGRGNAGWGVQYDATMTWTRIAETLEQQRRYGQGHIDTKHQCTAVYDKTDNGSWGPVLDGSLQPAWNGQTLPFVAYGNKLKDYFRTGFSQGHALSVSSATEHSHFRSSFGYTGQTGIFPKEEQNRVNVDLHAGTTLNRWLSMEGKVALSRTQTRNRPLYGDYGAVSQLMRIPNNVRLEDLQQYADATHVHVNWTGPTASIRNPYYILHQHGNSDERWRAFGYYSLKLNWTDWLQLSGKYAFDYYHTRVELTNAGDGIQGESHVTEITNDSMDRSEENFFESNAEVILSGNPAGTGDFRWGFHVGANFMFQRSENLGVGVGNLLDKGNWILNAAHQLRTGHERGYKRAMNSVFGAVQLTWKDCWALDVTARNDWSSTLPQGHNAFFYPSVSVSWMLSDFFRSIHRPLPEWVTWAKVRLSAAQVGKDTDPYQLQNTYSFRFDEGVLVPSKDNVKKNDRLKPEIATSYEAGLDVRLWDNRFGFDLTYYYGETKNQIMKVPAAAPWSGGQWVNAGKVTNQGVELMCFVQPLRTSDWNFEVQANLAHNVSKVVTLAPEAQVQYMFFNGDSHFPVKVGARAGHPLGEIYATTLYKRTPEGEVEVNANGLPMTVTDEATYVNRPIGNLQPKLRLSLTPTLRFKGFTLSSLFDMKFGGDIFSYAEMLATANGLSRRTLERGEDHQYRLVFPGVTAAGVANSVPISASEYYGALQPEDFIYDASFIQWKELSLGYTFPSAWLKRTPVRAFQVSLVARNLCYLQKHTPGTPPSGGYDTSMFSQAIDYASLPSTRTWGVSVHLSF